MDSGGIDLLGTGFFSADEGVGRMMGPMCGNDWRV